MKKILVGISICWSFVSFSQATEQGISNAQKPEPVYSIAKEVKDISWYEKQLKLWKTEIDKNNKNGEAWTNYYMASRALRNLSEHASAEKKSYLALCTQIVTDVQKAMPNSFEAYYLAYSESGIAGPPENLMKAAAINPNDNRILDDLMIHYLVEGNNQQFDVYAKKMFEVNDMPVGMLNWGYNVLSELDENAVLFTCGDNDTYACWIVQAAKNFRKDVTIVNTSLIQLDDYRKRMFQELGYPPLALEPPNEEGVYQKNVELIYNQFLQGKKPVYVATTAIHFFEEKHGANLYLTGLAYKYSKESFDNESIIRRNYEKRYLLDYLKQVFAYNMGDLKGEEFNGLYLPSMLKLYKQYEESEEINKKIELETLLIKIAEQNGQQSEILELLNSDEKSAVFLSTVLDLKTIEKNMLPVSGKTYMDKYEVTNGDYRKFLSNLQRSNQTDLYTVAMYDSTQWTKKFPGGGVEPMMEMYQWHPAYDNYPVVCISYEGAKAYCEWLTKQYNLQRKRTYTQVLFRLPTEVEWKTAAGSGDAKAITPFPNNAIQNASGCYLGNIQTSKGRFFDDGGFFQTKVETYEPNKMGFFNMLGNVSEMTSTKSKALGGSWYNLFEECTFDKTQQYANPDPGIGFRVVMEVIEK